uniref:Uncharacterized protein n=1 Tax=Nelumbo nucifera TaxID=4432 RepID=A0A822Y9A3_NELNU|nr:TPA_asm: hypothetical protein HUJ06_029073 [Nelumbo nucifera]
MVAGRRNSGGRGAGFNTNTKNLGSGDRQ